MAISVDIEVKGVKKVRSNIKKVKRASKRAVNKAIREVVKQIKIDAKANAPLGPTGDLRKSARREVKTNSEGVATGAIWFFIDYAVHNEFGTSRGTPAVHFLQRAVNSNLRKLDSSLRRELVRALVP